MTLKNEITAQFNATFSDTPTHIIRAPGRVNLIGEHTDYNDGFVLPMAINRAVWIALRPRDDRQIIIHLIDYNQKVTIDLDDLQKDKISPVAYVKGVAWALQNADYTLNGWEGVLKGDVPIGAGLSSSAALEMATAQAFATVSGFAFDPPKMATLGQRVENQWIGVNSGIMDQMISAAGQRDRALLIDCRSLETTQVPLPPETAIVILDTSTRRGLAGSAYNDRRASCEKAAAFYGVPALRDLDIDTFKAKADQLDDETQRRARHIITENARVLAAKDAMLAGDAEAMGQLMNASHVSMRDDFEISADALNAIVACAQAHDACYGARMTGGGFAGCGVALVRAEQAEDFAQVVTECYRAETGLDPNLYITTAEAGAGMVE